jgi:uncharacterized membrane protein YkgB
MIDSHNLRTSDAPPEKSVDNSNGNNPAPRDAFWSLNRAFYVIGAVAGVGFLMVLSGAYLVPEIWVNHKGTAIIVAGTIVVTGAAIAWIAAAVVMISMMIKHILMKA